ncbi:hypothetical protein [Aminobacter carboxidus]|uniref:Uncharacterized protein n=1 Tax=Aminobacter carboxidus TaxID=376165 RepID=A0ABR9GWW4_9HYPH|nr:hypothetical protein [Aminobacter carboxidus]MBE1208168.1 hypothetical protein [Aminobacter carboxidus]
MADRPILFSGPMVRALLADRKTQTRRIIDFAGVDKVVEFVRVGFDRDTGVPFFEMKGGAGQFLTRPKGRHFVDHHYSPRFGVGDRLYVREAHAIVPRTAYRCSEGVEQMLRPDDDHDAAIFRCGWDRSIPKWRPGIHMPRWASRLTLTVTDVRVQRLQEISEADAIAEGAWSNGKGYTCFETNAGRTEMLPAARPAFAELWNSLNAERGYGWYVNPWVTVTTFAVERRNIDEVAP